MIYPREIEPNEALEAIAAGAIWPESYGSENTYYADEFGNAYFCKNYPQEPHAMTAAPIKITNAAEELTAIIAPREDGRFAVSFWNLDETCSLGFARICPTMESAEETARDYVDGRPKGPISIRIL